jgi:hypothetical protein
MDIVDVEKGGRGKEEWGAKNRAWIGKEKIESMTIPGESLISDRMG